MVCQKARIAQGVGDFDADAAGASSVVGNALVEWAVAVTVCAIFFFLAFCCPRALFPPSAIRPRARNQEQKRTENLLGGGGRRSKKQQKEGACMRMIQCTKRAAHVSYCFALMPP